MGTFARRAAALLTGAALSVSVVATAELPASAATTSSCAASFSSYRTIHKGSTGAQAKAMECLLAEAGRSTTVNGSFSAHDAAELKAYRKAEGFRPLTSAGRRQWAALLSRGDTPVLEKGDKGADVLRLQRSLQSLGWTKIDINGSYDSRTVTAVKAAQKQGHLKQSGSTADALWKALQNGKLAGPAKPKKKTSSRGEKALAFARKQLGDRYRFGGNGPSAWDCSGLTRGAWKHAGVNIPRTSQSQYHSGKKVSKSHLRKGDLVFFYSGPSHVAIYAGNGKVIHAPSPGKKVSYIKMKYMPFKGARRPS